MKILIIVFALLSSASLFAQNAIPRQKITLLGKVVGNKTVSLSINDLEEFKKSESLTIHDPYNKNIKTTFFGFYLQELIAKYAQPSVTKIKIKAIDGYQVEVPRAEVTSTQLFFAFKDDQGYLSVDRMGPVRIIAPFEGIIDKELLLKLGVNWVWKIKSLEFIN